MEGKVKYYSCLKVIKRDRIGFIVEGTGGIVYIYL